MLKKEIILENENLKKQLEIMNKKCEQLEWEFTQVTDMMGKYKEHNKKMQSRITDLCRSPTIAQEMNILNMDGHECYISVMEPRIYIGQVISETKDFVYLRIKDSKKKKYYEKRVIKACMLGAKLAYE